jgi:hypothetical protein
VTLQSLIDRAKAAGRHSDHPRFLCGDCYQWVPAIHHVTFDGSRVCRACAVPAGCACPVCAGERERRLREVMGGAQ